MSWRKIVVDGEMWRWRATGSIVVARREGRGTQTHKISIDDITETHIDQIERMEYKNPGSWFVGPGHVARWIKGIVNGLPPPRFDYQAHYQAKQKREGATPLPLHPSP